MALSPTRDTFGEDNIMTARMLEELAMIRRAQNRPGEAAALHRQVASIYEARYEPTDVPRALWEIERSTLQAQVGDVDGAAQRLVELARRLEHASDDRSELRERVVRALVEIYSDYGRSEDARRWTEELSDGS